jgi:hypothetical protein
MPSFEDILLKISRGSDVDADQLGIFGKKASKHLVEDGVHPNETIQKIANDEGLNSHEIKRVCEFANLETYNHHMKEAGAGDKTFEHPVADYSSITASETEKSAMPRIFSTEYDQVPDADLCQVGDDIDVFEAFGVEPPNDKVASLKRADMLIEKLTLLAQNERDKLAMNLETLKEDGDKFYHHIKQQVLSNGGDFDKVHKAVKAKVEGKPHAERICALLDFCKRKLYDTGVLQSHTRTGDSPASTDSEKKAEPVQKDLLTDMFESPGVPVTVLNGRHPLFASIDTLVRQFDERDKAKNNLIILDDKIRYTKHRVYGKQPL